MSNHETTALMALWAALVAELRTSGALTPEAQDRMVRSALAGGLDPAGQTVITGANLLVEALLREWQAGWQPPAPRE